MNIDLIKRGLVSLLSGAVVAYALFLLITGVNIVQPGYGTGMNILALLIMVGAAGYVGTVYGIYPVYHPMQKRVFFILGLFLIVFAHYMMINNGEHNIYATDITKLFGVLIIWFGATGILSKNKKIQAQKQESKLEIIEA